MANRKCLTKTLSRSLRSLGCSAAPLLRTPYVGVRRHMHPAHIQLHFNRRRRSNTSSWYAIQAVARRRHDYAILAAIADRRVADLPENIADELGIPSPMRKIKISAKQQHHIIKRRQIVSKLDVELCIGRLAEAIANIQYQLIPQRDTRVFELIGLVPSPNRRILFALKFIDKASSKSGKDELWIRTAYPFGQKKFKKKFSRGELRKYNKNYHTNACSRTQQSWAADATGYKPLSHSYVA
jgi:hypothetical protein